MLKDIGREESYEIDSEVTRKKGDASQNNCSSGVAHDQSGANGD